MDASDSLAGDAGFHARPAPHLPVSGVRVTGKKDYLPMDLLAAC